MMIVERYSHIMHMTSQVLGPSLAPGKGPIDVLRATFAGGAPYRAAPKVRAMQIIDDLEPTKRRASYGGGGRLPRLLRQPGTRPSPSAP